MDVSSSTSINHNSSTSFFSEIQSLESISEQEMIPCQTTISEVLNNTESGTVSVPNGTVSVPLPPVLNGSFLGSCEPTSRPEPSSVHQPKHRPFNQINQRGDGFNSMGEINGNSSKRHAHHGGTQRTSNRWISNARQPRFANHPALSHELPIPWPISNYYHPHSIPIENPIEFNNMFYLQPWPPHAIPWHAIPCYDPYLTVSLPPPTQVPYVNVIGPPSYHQPPQQTNMLDSEWVLCDAILKQIEYYFSDENLRNDYHLKKNMDEEGWVSIHLIAGFNLIKLKTNDINLVIKSLQPSSVVEVQDKKVRRRDNWRTWILPHI